MNILAFLIPIALALGSAFVVAFVVAARKGQYDDLETPAHRILFDDSPERKP
jgi:cbb3-type cytochrome oxidase maturation protein